eukprot:gene14223-16780_t
MKGGSGKYDGGVSSPKSNVLKRIKDIFGASTPPQPTNTTMTPLQQQHHGSSGNVSQSIRHSSGQYEFDMLNDKFRSELNYSRNLTIGSRLSYLKEIVECIKIMGTNDNVEQIWASIADLVDESKSVDSQCVAYQVMASLIDAHYGMLGSLRADFFAIIASHSSRVPLALRVKALAALVKHGKDLIPFETAIVDVLARWISVAGADTGAATLGELFDLASNVIRHGQRILSEGDVASLINTVCLLSNSSTHIGIIEACLSFFETVATRLQVLPPPCIAMVIGALSRTVNIDIACDASCTTMSKLLARYGHQGIHALCTVLNDPHNRHTINLLRGAVFFLGMSIWGPQRISALNISPAFVLPALFNSLIGRQEIIAFEVILAIRRLIKKYGRELHVEWDLIFLIVTRIHALVASDDAAASSLARVLRDTLDHIEDLASRGLFSGSHSALFTAASPFFRLKSEDQVARIIDEQAATIHPSHALWLVKLSTLVDFFFKHDTRTRIRTKMLRTLKSIYQNYSRLYGDEIVENIVLPALADIPRERDLHIRVIALELVVELSVARTRTPSNFRALIVLLDRALRDSPTTDAIRTLAMQGLVSVFSARFSHPSPALTIETWTLLIGQIAHEMLVIRREALTCLARLSATKWYQMAYSGAPSPFLHCAPSNHFLNEVSSMVLRSPRGPPPTTGVPAAKPKRSKLDGGFFSVSLVWQLLVERLTKETSFELYSTILEIIAAFLKNKYILIGLDTDIDFFVGTLSRLLNERTLGQSISDYQGSDGKKETLYILGFEILCNLVSYISSLSTTSPSSSSSQAIISTLFNGLCQKWSFSSDAKHKIQAICLNGLTFCVIEFPIKTTLKYIQNITKALHQVSTSSNTHKDTFFSILQYLNILVSIPTLATQLPFETLTFIFRLLIQFFDRSKYSSLVVLGAFQSLIRWFTACSMSSRTILVRNIIKGLDGQLKEKNSLLNEISIELLNRYIHTDYDPFHYPMRHSSPIFHDGLVKTWIQGFSLVTIRTGKLGWAEVTHRKATGCVVWLMRFQNNFNPSIINNHTENQLFNLPKQPYFRKEFSPLTSPTSPSMSPISVSGEYTNPEALSPTECFTEPAPRVENRVPLASATATQGDTLLVKLTDLAKQLDVTITPPFHDNGHHMSTLNLSLLPDSNNGRDTHDVLKTPVQLLSSQNLLVSPHSTRDDEPVVQEEIVVPVQVPSTTAAAASVPVVDNQQDLLRLTSFNSETADDQSDDDIDAGEHRGFGDNESLFLFDLDHPPNQLEHGEASGYSRSYDGITEMRVPMFSPTHDSQEGLFLQNFESPYKQSYGSGDSTPSALTSLAKFYPPLPSFDDDEEILSFFSGSSPPHVESVENCKLNLSAQLLLHVGSSSPPNMPLLKSLSDSVPIEIPDNGGVKSLNNSVPSSSLHSCDSPTFSRNQEIFSLSVDDDDSPYLLAARRLEAARRMAPLSLDPNVSVIDQHHQKIAKEVNNNNRAIVASNTTTTTNTSDAALEKTDNPLKDSIGLVKSTSFTIEHTTSSPITDASISPIILEPTPTQSPIDVSFHGPLKVTPQQQTSFKPISPNSPPLIPKEGPISSTSKSIVPLAIQPKVPPIQLPPNINQFSQRSL